MRETLILFFLIISYNFLLWYITFLDLSPVPLFPEDPYHVILVLSYNSVLFTSWLFGERQKSVLWIGYLFFFQIVGLSAYLGDLSVVVRDLPPVILTFALVVLFESPTEKELREIWKEREELLTEIGRVTKERERVEAHLRILEAEIEKLQKERAKKDADESTSKELEEKINKLQKELRDYKEKENRLLEANRKLFHLLETMQGEGSTANVKGELSSLRRERKRLIKELISLQELVDIYADENEKLKEESSLLRKEVEKLKLDMDKMRIELESSAGKDIKPLYKEVLESILRFKLSDRAVEELIKLPPDKRKFFLRELFRLSVREGKENLQPLATLPNVYKFRFSGGRIYLRRSKGMWEVVGILDSEDDKEKERYIRDVLSKIESRV